MDTDRAGPQFDAVENQVVGLSAAMRRVGGKFVQIVGVDRSEWVMSGVPALLPVIPFEHRKIHHPQKPEVLRIEQAVPLTVLLSGMQAQGPGGPINFLFGVVSLGGTGGGSEDEQIVLFG